MFTLTTNETVASVTLSARPCGMSDGDLKGLGFLLGFNTRVFTRFLLQCLFSPHGTGREIPLIVGFFA